MVSFTKIYMPITCKFKLVIFYYSLALVYTNINLLCPGTESWQLIMFQKMLKEREFFTVE